MLRIDPARLAQFGARDPAAFCLVTDPTLAGRITIVPGSDYAEVRTLVLRDSFAALLCDGIPERADIFVIAPQTMFASPEPGQLGSERRLVVMPCHSTPTPDAALAHFLEIVQNTDVQSQERFADVFVERGAAADLLEIADEARGTSAVFEHQDDSYEWNVQAGPVEGGQQQIAPAGEISALPLEIDRFDPSRALAVTGTIALYGAPIVHSGAADSDRAAQAALYSALAPMRDHAVIVHLRRGTIVDIVPFDDGARPAAAALLRLLDDDAQYRSVWEIGFGIHQRHALWDGNAGMNEVYGSTSAVLHLGLGLTPFTRYALTFLCPASRVTTPRGELMAGPRTSRQRSFTARRRACPCLEM